MGRTQMPLWTVPYARNPLFTGREDLLARVAHALLPGQAAALQIELVLQARELLFLFEEVLARFEPLILADYPVLLDGAVCHMNPLLLVRVMRGYMRIVPQHRGEARGERFPAA